MMKIDSIIFDMDGTLWDNVDTYVSVWNRALETKGYDRKVKREELSGLMGKDIRKIMSVILPGSTHEEQDILHEKISEEYRAIIPSMTPIIYPYVLEGLERLKKEYKLFLLSNCEKGGLVNFMNHTNTSHLITDYMEHGQNHQPKSVNMKLLIKKHNLENPVYVGDTDTDSKESQKADVPFVYAAYGFGDTNRYDLKFNDFKTLTDYFMKLK